MNNGYFLGTLVNILTYFEANKNVEDDEGEGETKRDDDDDQEEEEEEEGDKTLKNG